MGAFHLHRQTDQKKKFTPNLSPFSTRRICSRGQTKKEERFLLVRGEFFRQPILTNHVAGFLFSLCVARTNSPSGKRALAHVYTVPDLHDHEIEFGHFVVTFTLTTFLITEEESYFR